MTNAQRLESATRFGRVVWDGDGVTAARAVTCSRPAVRPST